jgi:biotin synthase
VIRVAIGSANVLGLANIKANVDPETAHFLTTGTCVYDCKFCTQARSSSADYKLLSRISWPEFEEELVYDALSKNEGKFKRVCLQVVHNQDDEDFLEHVKMIKSKCDLPLSVDLKTDNFKTIRRLFSLGADCVGLPMDAANDNVFSEIKEGSFSSQLDLIKKAALEFPQKISTHIIIGLGETEEDAVKLIRQLNDLDVTVGLFAFTPVLGTQMENFPRPDLNHYRRIQTARYLICNGFNPDIKYNDKGRIVGFGYTQKELKAMIKSAAFQTTGCSGCNRPYYNEKPGGVMYNYPCELTISEHKQAISQALCDVEAESG